MRLIRAGRVVVFPVWAVDWTLLGARFYLRRVVFAEEGSMADVTRHATAAASARSLLGGRLTRHPERYIEIISVFRKYDVYHVVAELGMVHRHEDEDGHVRPGVHDEHAERHAK